MNFFSLSLPIEKGNVVFFFHHLCVIDVCLLLTVVHKVVRTYLKKCRLYHVIFAQELRTKRPFKIWDSWRNVRKGLVVSNFEELIVRGKKHVDLDKLVIKLEHQPLKIRFRVMFFFFECSDHPKKKRNSRN